MKTSRLISIVAMVAGACGSAHAEGVAVTPNLGMPTGNGVDITYRLSPRFNVRAGVGIPASIAAKNIEFGDVKYDITIKTGGINVFLDWHPLAGNLHVSGGIVTMRTPWALKATSVSSYTINGTPYAAADVGRLTGEIGFGKTIAPAILVGWGNGVRPGKKWGVVFDMGLAYVGKKDFRLQADGPLMGDPEFIHDFEEEQRFHSADSIFTPVLKIGASYQF
ncbi:MAG: hypothetical protein JXO72_16265 [Vicinamibacteria bacterium]|nr:hypothetical protein [Vicinamibacteria bacterium]